MYTYVNLHIGTIHKHYSLVGESKCMRNPKDQEKTRFPGSLMKGGIPRKQLSGPVEQKKKRRLLSKALSKLNLFN